MNGSLNCTVTIQVGSVANVSIHIANISAAVVVMMIDADEVSPGT